MGNVLDVVLAVFNPFSGRKDGVQDVLGAWLGLHRGQLRLLFGGYTKEIMIEF